MKVKKVEEGEKQFCEAVEEPFFLVPPGAFSRQPLLDASVHKTSQTRGMGCNSSPAENHSCV
jgi:hypothetical protein